MSPPQTSRTRKGIIIFTVILGLILGGTIVVLGTVSYALAIPPEAFLSEVEIPWDQDTISPIRDVDTFGKYYSGDWDGRVEQTDSWDRLYDVVPLEGEKIPRLIHQTWKTDTLPEKWRDAWIECREGMPDYEYMLWTDELSRKFIETHYPEFLPTFDGYKYPIQRADSIRYFILHHFGGIYMDLDIGCRRRMDSLLGSEVILPITKPVGVSNDLLFSAKGSGFMESLIESLTCFDIDWIINYPTVMFSTGPMFVSAMYALWNTHDSDVRILPKSLYGKNALPEDVPHSFFAHFYGSSWHDDDAGFFWFLADHGTSILIFGSIMVLLAAARLVWIKRRIASGYSPLGLASSPTMSPPPSPRLGPQSGMQLGKKIVSRLLSLPSILGRRRPIPSIRITDTARRRSSDGSTATLVDYPSSPLLKEEKIPMRRSPRPSSEGMEEVDAFLDQYEEV